MLLCLRGSETRVVIVALSIIDALCSACSITLSVVSELVQHCEHSAGIMGSGVFKEGVNMKI